MQTLADYCEQIKELYSEGKSNSLKFQEILDLFKDKINGSFTKEEIRKNSECVSKIVFTLSKLKKHDQAVNFIDNYLGIDLKDINNDYVVRTYGWCLFHSMKGKYLENDTREDFESDFSDDFNSTIEMEVEEYYKKIDNVKNILGIKKEENSVVVRLIFGFSKVVAKKAKNKWELALELLEKIDIDLLNRNTTAKVYKGKPKEFASDYETWHAKIAKAYYELGKYEECKKFSLDCLNANILSHYDNDIWFKRRIALSDYHIGNLEAALSGIKEVIKIKKDWFVQKELAEIYYGLENYEDALKYAIDSTLNRGELKVKWELYYLIYQILMKIDDITNALLFLKFAASIRLKEGWKLGEKLQNSLDKNNISMESIDFNSLQKKIENFANSMLKVGEIKNINYQSKMGFISDSIGDTYFRFNVVKGRPDKLQQGDEVYFSSDISYDRKKERDSIAAVFVLKK